MVTSSRQRLSREQSQADTRERLLAAARAEIVRGGVMAASLRGICAAAGYSQGAFYSNFDSKDDLLLELMARHMRDETQALRALVAASANSDLDGALRRLAVRLAELSQTREWSLLAVELELYAQRDATFAVRYDAAKAAYHSEFAAVLDELVQRYRLRPALPSLQMAIGLYALWCGFAVQGTVSAAIPRGEMLLAFFRAVTGAPAPSYPQGDKR
jgi:AcrR family transcriptional regulator